MATVDVSKRDDIRALVETAQRRGEVTGLIHAAGVSPSQASPATIRQVDLYGTAIVLEDPAFEASELAVGTLLMGPDGGFITGSDILMDGGVTASYWYGDVREVRT